MRLRVLRVEKVLDFLGVVVDTLAERLEAGCRRGDRSGDGDANEGGESVDGADHFDCFRVVERVVERGV